MLTVIVGPCGAGKTTWAYTHYPDHYHPDAENLLRTLVAHPDQHRLYPHIRALGQRLVHTAASSLLAGGHPVCLTGRGATRRERAWFTSLAAAHNLPVHVVLLAPAAEECVRRAQTDPTRPRTSRSAWGRIVENWFRDWEPVDADAEGFTYEEVPC